MIQARSRVDLVLGGAAGYLVFAFVVLLMSYGIQQRFHFPPLTLGHESQQFGRSADRRTTNNTRFLPAIRENRNSLTMSDLRPKPPAMANDSLVLEHRHLLFPLRGVDRSAMKNSFWDPRPGGRTHEGVDILAPRNTPILAVEDGVIGKLWLSHDGGITIYQFDPTRTYIYYYAHLERYAPGVQEGSQVKEGQVIGYVGTSGNAPPNTPHLHFAIYRVTEPGHWYHGQPINPYPILSSIG